MIQTVIPCGGKGTRISGGNPDVNKGLVEIGERPILWHVMRIFAAYGYKDFILALGHRGDLIRRYFLEYERMNRDVSFRLGKPDSPSFIGDNQESDWQVTLIDTGIEPIKGERLLQVAPHITGERFFLTYNDGVADIDIDALLQFHLSHGRLVTVTGYQPVYQYGIVEPDAGGRVTAYHQYPRMGHWINAGFMVIERAALAQLEPGMDLETGLLVRMAEQGELMLYQHGGFWRSMDTFKEAQELNEFWESGRAPWKVW
jgi:glucose-1-phosphate cytidylyltransferase